MKKILQIIGTIFLLVVASVVGLVSYSYFKAEEYNNTAVPFIKEKIPELSSWNSEVMQKYRAPSTLEISLDENLTQVTTRLTKLGELKSFEEPEFVNIESSAVASNKEQTLATYNILSRYENGDALFTVKLLEVDGGFSLYTFHVTLSDLVE